LGDEASLLLYEDGDQTWTSGLPTFLYNKLNGRQKSLPPPEYVSMGSHDRYYVRFQDGKSEWVGCEHMTRQLKNTDATPRAVSFGKSGRDSYFILFEDGDYSYQNIPGALVDFIEDHKDSKLEKVALGPNGEWFVETDNARGWGSLSTRCRKHVGNYENLEDVFVTDIVFGRGGQYIFKWEHFGREGDALLPPHISSPQVYKA